MFNDSNWKEILKKRNDPLSIGDLTDILGLTPKMVRKYLKRADIEYKVMSRKFYVSKATWMKHVRSVFKKVGYASPNDMARVMTRLNHMWEAGINPPPPEPDDEQKEILNKKLIESRRIGYREGYAKGRKEKTSEAVNELSEDGFTNRKIANLLNISENEVKNYLDPETGVILQIPKTS
jgi:predicted transcriptional regulator